MKTITIPGFKDETNFHDRAVYVFSEKLFEYYAEEEIKQGEPLGKDLAIFVSVMTKEEIEALKKMPEEEQKQIMYSSVEPVKKV